MDRIGGTLDYMTILLESEVPPTLIPRYSFKKIVGPKLIDCRLNPLKETQAMKPYNKVPRVGCDLCGRKEIDIHELDHERIQRKLEAGFQSLLADT